MTGNSALQKKMIVIVLSVAVAFVGLFSLASIKRLQGNARVINYTGVVRGGTQRLVKEELHGTQDNALMARLESIIEELMTGEGKLGLIRLDDEKFQSMMSEMKERFGELKEEIMSVRQGKDKERLFELSQEYFELADQTVSVAERYSEKNAETAEICFLVLTVSFIMVACALLWFSSVQRKRQRALKMAEEENREKRKHLSQMAKAIQVPMDEISELIYITDVENYDLLFINEAGKKTFHLDDVSGKKCYKSLQGLDGPCPFCTTDKLRPGENYDWEVTNPLTGRHYMLKDRLIEWNGRKARMEIAFDMTQAEYEKDKLKYALDVENTVMECIRILYQGRNLEKDVNQVLRQMGEFLHAERTYLFSLRDDLLYNDFEWCKQGTEPQKEAMQGVPLSIFQRWLPAFSRQECIVIEDVGAYKESSPEEYETLSVQGIKSLVAAPMEDDGVLVGVLGVDNPPAEKISNISAPLQTLCYFILLAFRRAENEKQLSLLSFQDTLTSFYNRNRFMKDLETLTSQEVSVGIVYLDVNGLKEVNDKRGHAQGDRLLVHVANKMRSVFRRGDCYRVGGDEFVIICQEIYKDKFEGKVKELRRYFESDEECDVAIGSRWAESAQGINQIVSEADADMYEDKKSFYRRNRKAGRYRHHNDEAL